MFSSKNLSILFLILSSTAALAKNKGGLVLPKQENQPVVLQLSKSMEGSANVSSFLQVFVGKESEYYSGKLAIIGSYENSGNQIIFLPEFGFSEGQYYVVKYRTANSLDYSFKEFNIQQKNVTISAEVSHIFPSGNVLPENVLRFYIHFSTPMQPHVALDHIKLIDADGNEDIAAFMKFKQELWSNDRKRLTLLFDPGRIKRGVATNEKLGPALEKGKQYTLKIDTTWQTATGKALAKSYEKKIRVVAPIRKRVTIENWKITKPQLHTKAPFVIQFNRIMDQELANHMISIRYVNDKEINGTLQLMKNEREWQFTPDLPWKENTILMVVAANLEDVSGNSFRDALDHKVGEETLSNKTITKIIRL